MFVSFAATTIMSLTWSKTMIDVMKGAIIAQDDKIVRNLIANWQKVSVFLSLTFFLFVTTNFMVSRGKET
jgi:hypothetical protein